MTAMSMKIREILQRRTLIWNFAVSDLKLRYRNSVLGFFWTILEPLLMLAVLYVVFTNLFPSTIENFGLYLLLGIILWNALTRGTEIGLNSILGRSSLVNQIYFPREIPAISASITSFLMLVFEFMVFIIFMVVFRFIPPITIIYLPLVILLEFVLITSLCLPLSVLNVRFRDIQFIWRLVLQVGFFLTPIFYRLDRLPENLQMILKYSPMVQIVDMAHNVTIYGKTPSVESVQITIIEVLATTLICYLIFRISKKRVIEEL